MILTGTTDAPTSVAEEAGRRASTYERSQERRAYSFPELWHLLSLDAPSVATVWTFYLARCANVSLPWSCGASLFLAVWLLYAGDRLLDARPLPGGKEPLGLEERHRFHWQHRRAFLWALGSSVLLLLPMLASLGQRTLILYLILALALAAWLLLVHTRQSSTQQVAGTNPRPLPKELMVGVFFGLAITVPTLARAPLLFWKLLPPAILFAAVCMLNCVLLYAWEHREAHTPARKERAKAHVTTRWAKGHVEALGMLVILTSLLMALQMTRSAAHQSSPERLASFAFCCGTTACLLLLLHANRQHFQKLTLRVAGDALLLAPLLFLLWNH